MQADEGSNESTEVTAPVVVGIGASAGGLAALRRFFELIPEDSGLAFVVVVHLSPEHKSHLAELLQRHVKMPAEQVTETVALEPNRVYVIPPNANLNTIDTHLRLSSLEKRHEGRAPIDHFFRTLAKTHGGHAVGIILTGTGSDGTLGIKEIKEKGGLTIVQDPMDAEYDGMPQSAIATGVIDLVLPLEKIPEVVMRYARTRPRIRVPTNGEDQVEESTERQLRNVFAQIRARTGRDFSRYKRSTLVRRIYRRMQLNQLEEMSAYVDCLRSHKEEVEALADDLLITVTNFFRDADVFEKLEREVIPRLFEGEHASESIRVWSVGCATGEEAYSLAMLLLEEASSMEEPPQIQIFASDLHERSLAKAREGFYPGDIEMDVSKERLKRFFVKEKGGYRIRKEVREMIVFAPHNLLGDPPFSKLDLIICRNLLIYLQRDMQRDVIALFHYALKPSGYLVLGTAESIETSELFRTEDKKLCLFRKRNVPSQEPHLPVFPVRRAPWRGLPDRNERAEEPVEYDRLHRRMLVQLGPPSLLVSPDDKIVHVSPHAGRFLVHPGGELTASAFKLVRDELRIELRTALHTAREQHGPVRSRPVPVQFGHESRPVVIEVRPATERVHEGFVLVIFEEGRAESYPRRHGTEKPGLSAEDAAVADLRAELDVTKERLQGVIEEYETSQEEMKASNEELQSANEELRSTLEELETSKEELQSMNEELQTVNQENRHKVEELAQLSNDLQNLLTATDIATLFLDRDLRILRFTPRVGDLFNVRSTDRGRRISDLTHRLGYQELEVDAEAVLRRLIPVERELEDDKGRWYLTRVLPYRSAEDRIEGVVITFVEITDRKKAEEELRQLNETLEVRVEQRTRQVRALASRLTMAEQEERRRIAHVLHEDLQQLLYGVEMKMNMISRHLADAGHVELHEEAERLRDWLGKAVATTRHLTVDLSPPILENEGLADALEWLRRQMEELHGLKLAIETEHEWYIEDEDMRVLLFQIVRELLFNVIKHSGVRQAEVHLEESDGHLVVHVTDHGKGFDPAVTSADRNMTKTFGLAHARERLELLGGSLKVHSRPGEGTHVEMHAPVGPAMPE